MEKIKSRLWLIYLCFGLILLSPFLGFKIFSKGQPYGWHALKINGQFVSPEIFHEEQNRFFMRWRRNAEMLRKTDEERNDLLLDEIINRVVVEDYLFHRAKVTVGPEEVENYITNYIRPKFSTISAMNNYLAESDFKSIAELKKSIDLYLRKLKCFSKIAKELGLTISPVELDTQYQHHIDDSRQVVVRHIQISNPDPEKARQRAEEVYRQLKNGADFSKLAVQYSMDPETKSQGGLMAPFSKTEAIPEIAQNAFNARPGDLIPPFSTRSGYEIVMVVKFINYYHPKSEFADMLLIEKFGESEQYQKWLSQVKSKLTIEILDPAMNAYRLSAKGQFNQAGALYEKVYADDNFEFNLTRAIECYESSKNWNKLIELGQLGINKYSIKVPYYLDAAEGLYRNRKIPEALNLMKRAEDLSTGNLYYLNITSQMCTKLGLEQEVARVKQKMKDTIIKIKH